MGLQGAEQQLRELQADLDDFSRPATKRAIAAHIDRLIGLFSCHNIGDPAMFGRVMLEKVGSREPAIGVLAQACEHLIETKKFLPAIAEVLEALDAQSAHLRAWRHMVEKLPQRIGELFASVGAAEAHNAKLEEGRARLQAESSERQRQKVRDAIAAGVPFDTLDFNFEPELIAEVRAEIAAETSAPSTNTGGEHASEQG